MFRVLSLAAAGLIAAAGLTSATASAADPYNMRSGQAVKMDRSAGKLSELAAIAIEPSAPAQATREVPNMRVPPRLLGVPNVDAPETHGVLSPTTGLAPALGLSFGGYDSDDNAALFGFRIMPPDTEGDVGLEHYVQWNNLGFKIFSKAGVLLNGPNGSAGNLPWAGFGGSCETENDGDPIVIYDHVAGRWFFSQFDVGPGLQCVAISDGEDPAGPYTRFAFALSIAGFNDYPKIGLWTSADGTQSAYHVTTNEFNGSFLGANLTALDRDAMLAAVGDPAAGLPAFVQFTIPPAAGTDPFAFSLQAGHLEGPVLPPAGTCETYIQAFDSETWGAAGATDGYRTWNFCVDFDTPANSTLTENALIHAGFEFDANLCGFGACVPQPNGQRLDTLSQFTMYRFAVRDVGGSLSGVISHSVDLGDDLAGIQWAQFDMSGGGPVLADIGQLSVGDGLHRWMPSISQDQAGNIAIGYSRSGSGVADFPSVYYTGRLASDPPGSLQTEGLCVSGTGSQSGGDRWGDYSTVSIDPSDDCTFWITNEYVETSGSFQWDTQICTFKFADCGTVCTNDADCDDGNFCNGAETCNTGTGVCEAGTPPACDDGTFCNGTETCNESTDSCDPGTPPTCDDGVSCTDDSCNTGTDSCDNVANDAMCDNGEFCDGAETCDAVNDCQAGSDPCPGEACDEVADICAGAGCGDGTCDFGEDCGTCPADCPSGPPVDPGCGNGTCEPGIGEDCLSCPSDCRGKQNGKQSNRYCCGDGNGQNPLLCSDLDGSICNQNGYTCSDTLSGGFCCGDLLCDEGGEECGICGVDCTDDPICDGGSCTLGQPGDSCDANADCCSNKCKGKPGNMTCR